MAVAAAFSGGGSDGIGLGDEVVGGGGMHMLPSAFITRPSCGVSGVNLQRRNGVKNAIWCQECTIWGQSNKS